MLRTPSKCIAELPEQRSGWSRTRSLNQCMQIARRVDIASRHEPNRRLSAEGCEMLVQRLFGVGRLPRERSKCLRIKMIAAHANEIGAALGRGSQHRLAIGKMRINRGPIDIVQSGAVVANGDHPFVSRRKGGSHRMRQPLAKRGAALSGFRVFDDGISALLQRLTGVLLQHMGHARAGGVIVGHHLLMPRLDTRATAKQQNGRGSGRHSGRAWGIDAKSTQMRIR